MSDYNDDFTSIDDEILFDENRGYAQGSGGGGGGSTFWGLKRGDVKKIYFTTPGPWTKESDHGWWTWREVFAEAGLVGVGELPWGMKAFPVRDQVLYTDADGNTRRRDISPSEDGYDHLLSLVVPFQGKFSKRGPERPVKDVVGVSVVEAAGDALYPKVLTFSANRYRKLSEILKGYRAMNKSFTLMGFPWLLSCTGESAANEIVSLVPLPDEPPIDLPDPIDIPEQLRQLRARVMEVVQSHTSVDLSPYAKAEETSEPSSAVSEIVDSIGDSDRSELYATMTDTRLRTLLTKAGVDVPPKTARDKLLALANTHQV